MHPQDERRLRPDRRLVVLDARPVRRPHLAESGAGAGEHVGNPEAVADLDQLTAGDEHLAALRERGQRQQHGGGVVVDDERGLRPGQPAHERGEVILPRAPRPRRQVVLEVGVAPADREHALERRRGERRATEIRVEEDTRRVEHSPELRPALPREIRQRPFDEVARIDKARLGASADLLSSPFERRTGGCQRQRARLGCEPLVAEQLVDGRQIAQAHEYECSAEFAATLSSMRRVAFRAGWMSAALVATAVAVVAARDAMYWEQPLPGVEVRALDLDRPIAVTVQGRSYTVRASEALVVDARETETAKRAAGRDSLLTRIRQLADPSPPRLHVDPVLAVQPNVGAYERLGARLATPRPARVERRGSDFAVVPARLGELIDGKRLSTRLAASVLAGRREVVAPLTRVAPTLTTDEAERATVTARELVSRPISLVFDGKTIGTLEPELLARLIRVRAAE